MKRNITIEDCPNCGHAIEGVFQNKQGRWYVECIWCENHSHLHKSMRGAIVAWNLGEVYGND